MTTSPQQNAEFEFFRPRPDGDIDPAGEAGWFLQREREERGISLEQASMAVNIHAFHLQAIEQGDLTGLPQRADALQMISIYAQYLGFDPEPLVFHFGQFLPKQPMPGHRKKNRKQSRRPAPLSSAKILQFPLSKVTGALTSRAGGIVASCLGAVLLFGAASWVFQPGDGHRDPGTNVVAGDDKTKVNVPVVANVDEKPLPDAPAKVSDIGKAADKSANGLTGLDALISKTGSDTLHTASVPKKQTDKIDVVGTSKKGTNGGRVYGNENTGARLVLTAKANVWVRIEDNRGAVVMTRTLMAGDSYKVPNRKGLVVISRDGGLLSYSIDGKKVGSLGRKGEILVGRPLDLTKLAKRG